MPLKGRKLKKEISKQKVASKILRTGGPRNVAQGRTVLSAKIRAEERKKNKYR